MPESTGPDLPGVGTVHPDGDAYRASEPVTIAQLRELARDARTSSMVVSAADGTPKFKAIVCMQPGRPVLVRGLIEVDE